MTTTTTEIEPRPGPSTNEIDAVLTWGGWDDDVRDDPGPHFDAVRSACPVHQVQLADGHEAWVVVGHEAARQALKDRRLSKDMLAAFDSDPDVADEGLPGPALARHMLAVDPPDHTRLRRLVAKAFTPSRVAALEPEIERITAELLDELDTGGPVVDLVAGFAHPLPFRVIAALLGLPAADAEAFPGWFRTLFQPWNGSPPPEAVAASDAIVDALERLVALHRERPIDDLTGVLVAASAGGEEEEQLTEQELLSNLFLLIVAGHDTTASLIGNGVVALLDNPDQLALLLRDPTLIGAAVEELVRFGAPVPHATFRVTTEPTELDGVGIPAGRQVLVCLAAANRDPSVFEDAERLDITRRPGAHVGFGHGIHFCLGAPLARLEARVAFRALFDRFPDLHLAVPRSSLAWSHGDGLVLRGLGSLPVHLRRPT